MAFNLFANIAKIDYDNVSFGDIEDDDVEEVKPVKPSKETKTSKVSPKRKKIPEPENSSDEEVKVVVPGLGQKMAFKKLDKLKQSLETAVVTNQKKKMNRSMNESLRQDVMKKRGRKARTVAETIYSFDSHVPSTSSNTNDSFEDDDMAVNLKLKWEGTTKLEKITFAKYKAFSELINQLSVREQIDAKSFLLMFGSYVIKPDDTPYSINYTLGKFISVRTVANPSAYIAHSTAAATASTSQSNTIEVKIQSSQWKKPMVCNIKLTDTFAVLAGICSEKMKCDPKKIRLKFDGDILSLSSTPEDNDFEGGEILDLVI